VPSPIYFGLGLVFLGLLVAQGVREDRLTDGDFLPLMAGVIAFVAFTAYRGRLYLRRRGWWPGTG
jgi:hypothetical protein